MPLRASRMIDFLGGDLLQAASELKLGYPGLSAEDPAVELILKQVCIPLDVLASRVLRSWNGWVDFSMP